MSKLEMNYKKHLELMMKASDLKEMVTTVEEQKPYPIYLNGIKVCTYILDFKVWYGDGRIEYVDVKGIRTQMFILKKKLFEAYYGLELKEVKRGQF